MIKFRNGGQLVQSLAELPDLRGAKLLYADFETTSSTPKEKSVNPWMHCSALGLCVTADDISDAWYIPIGHHDQSWNLSYDAVCAWWNEVLDSAGAWINHNIKYDAHVSTNWLGAIPLRSLPLIDTLTLAKIIDSDRMRYSLDVLSREWLGEDIGGVENAMAPYLVNNKDYGAIPADLMAEYGCQDVITTRKLYRRIMERMPPDCKQVMDTEIKLTRVLFEMERTGMCVTSDLKVHEYKTLVRMLQLDDELTEITGASFRPDANKDCYRVLCQQYGLPVLGWTAGKIVDGKRQGEPSFDKHALAAYRAHPHAPQEIIERIIEYRMLANLMNFFIKPYTLLQDDEGVMHPSYNQAVRTGRMSCSTPNATQLSKAAKKLVVPPKGFSFLSIDYSQIEFRLMMHYINDAKALDAYAADPDVDFHALVAEWCEIKRRPAKTINFGIGFGMGKKKVAAQLAANVDLVGPLKAQAELMATGLQPGTDEYAAKVKVIFEQLCQKRGDDVFDLYHLTFPTLKPTTWRASDAVKRRGYVYNLYGRRRHLPPDVAHIAFNTLNQSSAADLMKERVVAVWEMLEGLPIYPVACVHDELLLTGPSDIVEDTRTIFDIISCMEHPTVEDKLRVPIRCSYGTTRTTWADVEGDLRAPSQYQCRHLEHLQ